MLVAASKPFYATQGAVRPPTFVFFCNDGRLIGDGYKRYLERSLREHRTGHTIRPVLRAGREKG
jgi:GTP-binding protein